MMKISQGMSVTRFFSLAIVLGLVAMPHVRGDERRAKPPTFTDADTKQIFYPKLTDALRGNRPSLSSLQQAAKASSVAAKTPAAGADASAGKGGGMWAGLISPESIEDEVKRVKLHFDSIVTTPGAFKSGGYLEARLDLSILAVMFAVVNDYGKEVRWKDQAATARDLLARSAFNCKAGSTQVYNEAKLRKGDLQDLVAGSGIAKRDAEAKNDWSNIVDRSPMMEYAEHLRDSLKEVTNDAGSVKSQPERIRREAELIAVLGVVLTQEGMDDYDDEDYAEMSKKMTEAARKVVGALEVGDAGAIRKAVGEVALSCETCHEQYR